MTTMTTINVAVVQSAPAPGDVRTNLEHLVERIQLEAADADLIVAPELATTGYDLDLIGDRGHALAESLDGPTISALAKTATAVSATIAVGFLEAANGKLYDSLAVLTPAGDRHRYRKSHLYPAEIPHFTPGDRLDVIDTAAGHLGPMICFEHAFPDIATSLALAGAQILLIPSAVPVGFEYLMELRTRARAQDNQVFAVAANLSGNGFCGRSLIANPRGELATSAGADTTVLRARLDLAAIDTERAQEPALRLRRRELYA